MSSEEGGTSLILKSNFSGRDASLLFSPASARAQEHVQQLSAARAMGAGSYSARSHNATPTATGGAADESRAGLLQVELDHANAKLTRQEELIRSLRREKDDADDQIRHLKNIARDSKDATSAEWRAKFQALSDSNDKLRDELRQEAETKEALVQRNRELETKLKRADAIKSTLEETQDELAKTEIILAQTRKAKNELQHEMDAMRKDDTASILRGKVSEATLVAEDAQKQCRGLKELNLSLVKDIEALKTALEDRDNKLADSHQAKTAIVVELQDLRNRIEILKRSEEEMATTSALAKEAQTISARSLADDLESAKHSRDVLESEIGEIHREHKRRTHSLEILLEQKTADNESLQKQLAIYKNKCDERSRDVSELEGQLAAERKRREQLEREASKDRIVVEDLKRQVMMLKEDAAAQDSEMESLMREKMHLSGELSALQDALEVSRGHAQSARLRDEIAAQTSMDLDAAEKQNIALQKEIEQLRGDLAAALANESKLAKANHTCEGLLAEVAQAQRDANSTKQLLEESDERFQNATSRIKIIEAKLRAEEGRREELASKLRTAEILNRDHESLQLSGKLRSLESNLNTRDGEIAKLVKMNNHNLESLSSLRGSHQTLLREHSATLEKVRSLEVRTVELNVERDELRLKVARSSGSEEAMSVFHSQQQYLISELQSKINELQSENAEMHKQLAVADRLEDMVAEERMAADHYREALHTATSNLSSHRHVSPDRNHNIVGGHHRPSDVSGSAELAAMSPVRAVGLVDGSSTHVVPPRLGGQSSSSRSVSRAVPGSGIAHENEDSRRPHQPAPLRRESNTPSFTLPPSQPSHSLQEPSAHSKRQTLSSSVHVSNSLPSPQRVVVAPSANGTSPRGFRPRPVANNGTNGPVDRETIEHTIQAIRAEMEAKSQVESKARDERIDALAQNLSQAIGAMKDLRRGHRRDTTPTHAAVASTASSSSTVARSPVRTASATKPPRTPSSAKRLMSGTAASIARQKKPVHDAVPTSSGHHPSTPGRGFGANDQQVTDEELSTILLDPSAMSDAELMRELETAKRQMKKVLLKKDRFVETPARNPRF